MDKKLPSVFANKISKEAAHNASVAYTSNNTEERAVSENDTRQSYQNINQKINQIFNSSRYVYKADVEIKLKNNTIRKKIIGKNGIHLITIDNELIPISDILDIQFYEG